MARRKTEMRRRISTVMVVFKDISGIGYLRLLITYLRIAMARRKTQMRRSMRKRPRMEDEIINCLCTLGWPGWWSTWWWRCWWCWRWRCWRSCWWWRRSVESAPPSPPQDSGAKTQTCQLKKISGYLCCLFLHWLSRFCFLICLSSLSKLWSPTLWFVLKELPGR